MDHTIDRRAVKARKRHRRPPTPIEMLAIATVVISVLTLIIDLALFIVASQLLAEKHVDSFVVTSAAISTVCLASQWPAFARWWTSRYED